MEEDIMKDERFAAVLKNPRFRKMPRHERKTKIDKRFQAMFKDKSFQLKHVVDKRGRPVECHTSSDNLKKFYDLSSESEGEDRQKESDNQSNDEKIPSLPESGSSEDEGTDLSTLETAARKKSTHNVEQRDHTDDEQQLNDESDGDDEAESASDGDSDSTTDEECSELSEQEDELDHKWQEFDADAPSTKEITKRIAVCNMDWDRIRADDILAVFNSFKPAEGMIESVKIYPSEFGLQRMEEEKLNGPLELVEKTVDEDGSKTDSNKEGSRYHREKLRQYQINRLKYYYAVVECDTPETADSLYGHLNGMEYESSAICMDIRFVPDDVTFDQEAKSVALAIPEPSEYKPRLFINSALQQVKVNLTWDETDPKRRETLQKAFREPESIEKDIRNYLASSSGSDDEEDGGGDDSNVNRNLKIEDRINNYKSLLQSLKEKEKDDEEKFEMEITWEPGLKEKTQEIVKEKLQKTNLNPFEEKIRKMKEGKKLKKGKKKQDHEEAESSHEENLDSSDEDIAISPNSVPNQTSKPKSRTDKLSRNEKMTEELSLLMADSAEDYSDDENRERKKKKKPKKKEEKEESKIDDFEVDIGDSRFSAIYTSHMYNIDPSDPQYKDSGVMQNIIREKQKRKMNHRPSDSVSDEELPQKQTKLSLESRMLVNSVKRKTEFRSKRKIK